MGDVADETALGCVQLHLAGEILHGDGDALERFPAGIAHGLQHDAERSGGLANAAAQILTVGAATQQQIEGGMQLDRQQIRQLFHQLLPLQIAAFPAEQTPSCRIRQHDPSLSVQQDGPIGHGGDQGLLFDLRSGELFDVGFVVGLQLRGHRVETGEQFSEFPADGEVDAGVEIAEGDGADAAQQLLHRPGDGEGVEHRAQNHQNPDGDEHRNGDLPGEGCTGECGFVGIDAEPQHAVVTAVADQRNEDVGDAPLGGEVLPHQRVLGSTSEFLRKFEPSVQAQVSLGG
ncbi:MAG: Uncharacterised protein [Synechococcus sp. CC9902]|nr:MAG: Uncharacterised protein [Synechococcus sp. CC9902]